MFSHKEGTVLLRFCAVGLGNTAVDFTVFFLLTLGGVPLLPAQALSYGAGVVNSFIFNRQWTFRMKNRANIPEVARFMVVNGLSLLVSAGLLFILRDIAHLPLWPGKLAATGAGILVNFAGSRLWVFTNKEREGARAYEDQKGSHSRRRAGHKVSAGHQGTAERNAAHC
jgi:putative flippase GtrA